MGISHAVRTPREASAARARWQIIRGRDATAGYLMIAPAAIILIVLIAYPFGLSLWLSMTNRKSAPALRATKVREKLAER